MARYNPRRAKINRAYRIEEIAELFDVHKRTIANWIKEGLVVCSTTRPMLIHGKDLRTFLEARSNNAKKPCRPGQLFCVACKSPQAPIGNHASLKSLSSTVGDLQGECPACHHIIHRRVSLAKISSWQGSLSITRLGDQGRLIGRDDAN